MPYLKDDTYERPWYLINKHFETIVPSLRNKADQVIYTRERIELSDGDFLDLDWLVGDSRKLLIISHGLEGSSDRHYVRRPASYFNTQGWSICAWNCRSCSGEMNRLPRFYHHGATEDLESVVDCALAKGYSEIVLMGFSMGGSMSLKYLGESVRPIEVRGAITFSVPCNLKDSALALERKGNRFYEKRFLNKLKKKIELKSEMHDQIDATLLEGMEDFSSFHDHFTVPLHGFDSLDQFYSSATCDQYLESIRVPVLIGNALNDPLLEGGCYPIEKAKQSEFVHLKTPRFGGHVGFNLAKKNYTWMELESEKFLQDQICLR